MSMDTQFQISYSRFQISDFRFQIPDSRFQIPDSRFQILNSRNATHHGRRHSLPSLSIISSAAFGPQVPASYFGISSLEFAHASSIGITISHPRSVISRRAYKVESPSMQSSRSRS